MTDISTKSELLPCPFCGGEARHNDGGSSVYGRFWWLVGCQKCDIFLADREVWSGTDHGMLDPSYPPKECFDRWNRRAVLSQPAAPQETAGEAVAWLVKSPNLMMQWVHERKPDEAQITALGRTVQPLYLHPTPSAAPTDNTALVAAWDAGFDFHKAGGFKHDNPYVTDRFPSAEDINTLAFAALASREAALSQPDAPQPTPEVEALREALEEIASADSYQKRESFDGSNNHVMITHYGDLGKLAVAALARGSMDGKGGA